MSYNKKNKNQEIPEPAYRRRFSYFITCSVFSILFAVRLHIERLTGKSLNIFASDNGAYADWFLYCKEILLFTLSVIIVLYAIGERIFPDEPCRNNPLFKKNALVPALLTAFYFFMSVLSALFSENKEVVLWGMCSEFEGIAAIFSYCILFFAGYNFFTSPKAQLFYRKAFFILIFITAALAVFEYTFTPILELPFMKYLIAPAEYRELAASLNISDTFRESVLMFYNSNYMGGFCTIICPVSIYYIVAADKLSHKIICGILCALAFTTAIMSNSTAAFYIIIIESLFLAIIMIAKRIIKPKRIIILFSAVLAVTIIVSTASGNDYLKTILKSIKNSGTYSGDSAVFELDTIEISGNSVIFSGNGSEYIVTPPYNSGEILEVSGLNDTIFTETKIDNNTIMINDVNTGQDINILLNEGILYLDFSYKHTIDFAVTDGGVKAIVQNAQLIDTIPESPFNDSSLSDYYGFATGRGYIWLNTLPILKDCWLIGKGAGNFPFFFIQNDIVGLSNTNGTYHIIVDKPHSWYLQIAVDSGIPALIAIFSLFLLFVLTCISVLFKTSSEQYRTDKKRTFMLCLFTGLCGFMIIGIVNDSMVTVNPFFWFNFGIAFCQIKNLTKEMN